MAMKYEHSAPASDIEREVALGRDSVVAEAEAVLLGSLASSNPQPEMTRNANTAPFDAIASADVPRLEAAAVPVDGKLVDMEMYNLGKTAREDIDHMFDDMPAQEHEE